MNPDRILIEEDRIAEVASVLIRAALSDELEEEFDRLITSDKFFREDMATLIKKNSVKSKDGYIFRTQNLGRIAKEVCLNILHKKMDEMVSAGEAEIGVAPDGEFVYSLPGSMRC